MGAGDARRVLVIDEEGRERVGDPLSDVERALCTFEASADWKDDFRRSFPDTKLVPVIPHHDGPWHAAVERDLAELSALEVVVDGVPLLDCFRSLWREQLTALRSLESGFEGTRRAYVTSGGPSAELLLGAAQDAGLDEVRVIPDGTRRRTHGTLARIRRAGVRGVSMALSSRFDPAGDRRARLCRRPRITRAETLLVSSYANPTRAALEARDFLGGGPAILLCTGPGATRGIDLPKDVVRVPLHAALALDRKRASLLRSDGIGAALASLREWDLRTAGWRPWASLQRTPFGRSLPSVHLAELVSVIVAVRSLVHASGARTLVAGDEFSFGDRAALHAARSLGLATVSRQHGVLDSHYLRDGILADRYLAWNPPTVDWLREHGAVGRSVVEVHPRTPQVPLRRPSRPSSIVVFLQPTSMLRVPFGDWLTETLPPVVRAASTAGLRVILKAHPLQTRLEVSQSIPPALRSRVELVTSESASSLLASAAAAVLLDSSVCLDAKEAGVPCLSTGWYHTPYGHDLARLGYLEPCATPLALEAALRNRTRGLGAT